MNSPFNRRLLMAGAILGGLAVALGAFAAHGLQKILDPDHIKTFQTGVHYQMIHALALIALTALRGTPELEKTQDQILGLWTLGTILFSGSLYALAMTGIPMIGMVTPLGGIFFLLGWAKLFFLAKQAK